MSKFTYCRVVHNCTFKFVFFQSGYEIQWLADLFVDVMNTWCRLSLFCEPP